MFTTGSEISLTVELVVLTRLIPGGVPSGPVQDTVYVAKEETSKIISSIGDKLQTPTGLALLPATAERESAGVSTTLIVPFAETGSQFGPKVVTV